ncbi:MAG: flagellar protein FliS [Actinomycetota bacterium]|nr:flagellar protein FliS [Actinomycetota bacterium]
MTNDPRSAYLDVGLNTAPPERLLLLLWDRLLVDLDVADDALHQGDLHAASERLIHAQDIVFELRNTLRVDVWDGASALARLYEFVEQRLVAANVQKDRRVVAECRSLLVPLHEAFHAAAREAAAARPAALSA